MRPVTVAVTATSLAWIAFLVTGFALLAASPAAAAREEAPACADGWDGDDDKLIDCDDPDCVAELSCLERGACDDGADNDADGLTDCADLLDCCIDAACSGAPGCPERDCDDGVDQDGDGRTDCADPDCRASAGCDESRACADGTDNDGDGRIDCADTADCCGRPECLLSPACPEGLCDDGVDQDGDGRTDCDDPDCAGPCSERGHCDDLVDNDGDAEIDCDDRDCEDASACDESQHCDDGEDNDRDGDTDCDDLDCCDDCPGAPGCPERPCDNGLDDDSDGPVDCADDDCRAESECRESMNCFDELDNDGDGLVDCLDPDCRCRSEAGHCTNGRDDDSDGLVDCEDSDCCLDPACAGSGRECTERDCDDGLDDDSDGHVDCDDFDCRRSPSCPCEFARIEACRADHGVLSPPTEDCQYRAGRACLAANPYEIVLEPGRTHVFTFCSTTCPDAFADFPATFVLEGPHGIAFSDPACDDRGELRFRPDPEHGVATYCLRIGTADSTWGGSEFRFGWFSECEPPAAPVVSPHSGRAGEPECSRLQPFTASAAFAEPTDWEWSITPPAGGSATPSAGTGSSADGLLQFESLLQGTGDHEVRVTARNGCAEATRVHRYALADRRGPSLQAIAEAAGCSATTAAPGPGPGPRRISRVRPKALGCAAPCTSGILVVEHPQFDVAVRCEDGVPTVRTGALHPATVAGRRLDVLYGGELLRPGTSRLAWRLHELGLTLENPSGASACAFDPPGTLDEPASLGIAVEWMVEPAPGLRLLLREEIVAFGDRPENAGVRISLEIANEPSSSSSTAAGLRWQLDLDAGDDDGPAVAVARCEPPAAGAESSAEHLYDAGELLDFLRVRSNTGPGLAFSVATAELDGIPGTFVPERVLYGDWRRLREAAWGHPPVEGDPGPDEDAALLLHDGWSIGTAPRLGPGESLRASIVLVGSEEGRGCGVPAPGATASATTSACAGDCVRVGVVASDACSSPGVTLVSTSAGAPPCDPQPCVVRFDVPGIHEYRWQAVDGAGQASEVTSTIVVTALGEPGCERNAPPSCDASAGPAACGRVALSGSGSDPDWDALVASWSTTCAGASFDPSASDWSPELVLPGECDLDCAVTLTVTDPGGLSASDDAAVSARDLPPELLGLPPAATVPCDAVPSPAGVVPADACDPAPSLGFEETSEPGPCPGELVLTRTWTARDRCGHESAGSQVITTQDRVPPVIDRDDSVRACLWPPPHRMRCLGREIFAPVVRDACSTATTWILEGCESDQPDDGLGDGSTDGDCGVSSDGLQICVRAERQGGVAPGRTYSVRAVAVDACGNRSVPEVIGRIRIPHDAADFERGDCIR